MTVTVSEPPPGSPDRSAVSHGHFQLFAANGQAETRWRLLSGNNRELGRSAHAYLDAETCRLAIKQLVSCVDSMRPRVRREAGQWQWLLLADDVVVVIGSHLFDRQVRCSLAAAQFQEQAKDARVAEGIMFTAARRWASASAVQSPVLTRRATPIRGLLR